MLGAAPGGQMISNSNTDVVSLIGKSVVFKAVLVATPLASFDMICQALSPASLPIPNIFVIAEGSALLGAAKAALIPIKLRHVAGNVFKAKRNRRRNPPRPDPLPLTKPTPVLRIPAPL